MRVQIRVQFEGHLGVDHSTSAAWVTSTAPLAAPGEVRQKRLPPHQRTLFRRVGHPRRSTDLPALPAPPPMAPSPVQERRDGPGLQW